MLVKRFADTDRGPDPFDLPATAVSDKLLTALTTRRPRARYRVTTPAHVMNLLRRLLPTSLLDWVIAKG